MIGYITIGTNDLEGATAFYDNLLNVIDANKAFQTSELSAWRFRDEGSLFNVMKPFDGNPATVGNGVMVALTAGDPKTVDKLHAKALELGATNEGSPGPRGKSFYGAYFRDLDGNKINFYCYT